MFHILSQVPSTVPRLSINRLAVRTDPPRSVRALRPEQRGGAGVPERLRARRRPLQARQQGVPPLRQVCPP